MTRPLGGILFALGAVVAVVSWLQYSPIREQPEITLIRIAVLPDQAEGELRRRYSPLLAHLSRETGFEFQMVVPESYDHLVRLFGNEKVDLAFFGGYTFVKAHLAYGARPLVMRDVDTRFTSYFVASRDGPLRNCTSLDCEELSGKVFSFGSKLSTSGHLMPRFFLTTEKKIVPESYFGAVNYTHGHDETAYRVRDGEADVGAINSEILRAMRRDGRLKKSELRVLWETPPYPNYVWAIPNQLDEQVEVTLRDAFLNVEKGDEEHERLLSLMGAEAFIPAWLGEFDALVSIIESQRLEAKKL